MSHLEMAYGMYVMSVPVLLELDQMQPHQVLLEKRLVREWSSIMHGRTIFVSHEWLGWLHPDPNGEQLTALKRILWRLINGEVPAVESYWLQQVMFKQNTVVTSEEWKAALPHMFVWLDFFAIPQMCVHDEEPDDDEEVHPGAASLPNFYVQDTNKSEAHHTIIRDQ